MSSFCKTFAIDCSRKLAEIRGTPPSTQLRWNWAFLVYINNRFVTLGLSIANCLKNSKWLYIFVKKIVLDLFIKTYKLVATQEPLGVRKLQCQILVSWTVLHANFIFQKVGNYLRQKFLVYIKHTRNFNFFLVIDSLGLLSFARRNWNRFLRAPGRLWYWLFLFHFISQNEHYFGLFPVNLCWVYVY